MKKKILVVDDEPITVDLMDDILSNEGYDILKAYNGKECLNVLKKESPNLILLDIMMPDMSGWDVFTRIQKFHKDLNVAFVSAIEVSNERLAALKSHGLKDYITKPFTSEDLIARVRNIIG